MFENCLKWDLACWSYSEGYILFLFAFNVLFQKMFNRSKRRFSSQARSTTTFKSEWQVLKPSFFTFIFRTLVMNHATDDCPNTFQWDAIYSSNLDVSILKNLTMSYIHIYPECNFFFTDQERKRFKLAYVLFIRVKWLHRKLKLWHNWQWIWHNAKTVLRILWVCTRLFQVLYYTCTMHALHALYCSTWYKTRAFLNKLWVLESHY